MPQNSKTVNLLFSKKHIRSMKTHERQPKSQNRANNSLQIQIFHVHRAALRLFMLRGGI